MRARFDKIFLGIVAALVIGGFFIFTSASLGLLAREGMSFSSVAFSQIFLGIILGSLALVFFMHIHYRLYRRYALYIFIGALLLTLTVFIPGLGVDAGGATRWIGVFGITFQPAELLKLGFVIYFAAWLSGVRMKIHQFRYGVLPFFILLALAGGVLLAQPDTGTFLVIAAAGAAMFLAAGARFRDLALVALVGAASVVALAAVRPYVKERLLTFFDPASDPLGASYQVQQSLIAIGSGEWFGRGFGQSVQKFNFLPQPIGDSIFAVYAEEFGFVGSVILIGLFLALALRGLKIASRAPDYFGGLLVTGIITLIVTQSFINIAAMLNVLPLTGMPLIFISHGGTALFIALAEIGIILNVSRYGRKP